MPRLTSGLLAIGAIVCGAQPAAPVGSGQLLGAACSAGTRSARAAPATQPLCARQRAMRLRGGARQPAGKRAAGGAGRQQVTHAQGDCAPAPGEELPSDPPRGGEGEGGDARLVGVPSADGHDALITCLQYKRGFVYTGSVDRTVRVWDATTGECLRVLERSGEGEEIGPGCVTSLAVTDRALWVGMSTGALNIWCLETFEWQGQVGAYWDESTKQGQFHPGSVDALLYFPPLKRPEGKEGTAGGGGASSCRDGPDFRSKRLGYDAPIPGGSGGDGPGGEEPGVLLRGDGVGVARGGGGAVDGGVDGAGTDWLAGADVLREEAGQV